MRLTVIFAFALTAFCAGAQDGNVDQAELAAELDLDAQTERCVFVRSINRIRAIDDSTLAFYMNNRRVYINLLPRRCPGLARYDRYAYETSSGRLCKTDRISVIYDTSGRDTGLPCPLGDFQRADREAVDLIFDAARQNAGTSPVTAEPVELPPEDDADTDEQ